MIFFLKTLFDGNMEYGHFRNKQPGPHGGFLRVTYDILFSMKAQKAPLPSGIFFDMDGTLLQMNQSSEQTWLDVFTHFAPQHQCAPEKLSQIMNEVYTSYKQAIAGNEAKLLRDRLHPFEVRTETVEQVLRSTGRPYAHLAEDMVRLYETLQEQHRQATPFALEILHQLQKQHIPLALLTNGNATYQRRKIEQHHLALFFEYILIEEEFGRGKSYPHIYQAALDHFHLQPQETWMIGDDLSFDVATPQQLGIFTFWFDPSGKGLPPQTSIHPDRIIRALPDVLQELRKSEVSPSPPS